MFLSLPFHKDLVSRLLIGWSVPDSCGTKLSRSGPYSPISSQYLQQQLQQGDLCGDFELVKQTNKQNASYNLIHTDDYVLNIHEYVYVLPYFSLQNFTDLALILYFCVIGSLQNIFLYTEPSSPFSFYDYKGILHRL